MKTPGWCCFASAEPVILPKETGSPVVGKPKNSPPKTSKGIQKSCVVNFLLGIYFTVSVRRGQHGDSQGEVPVSVFQRSVVRLFRLMKMDRQAHASLLWSWKRSGRAASAA